MISPSGFVIFFFLAPMTYMESPLLILPENILANPKVLLKESSVFKSLSPL